MSETIFEASNCQYRHAKSMQISALIGKRTADGTYSNARPRDLPRSFMPQYCGYKGPLKKTRVDISLLGERIGTIHCPRVLCLGLDFGDADPVRKMESLLAARGLHEPERLRSIYITPQGCSFCRQNNEIPRLHVESANPYDVLYQGLLLGLCTATFYDPSRIILWTTASLTRSVELFDIAGFYA